MPDAVLFERDRAYRGIVDLILGGQIAVHDPLSERGLAGSLEIGRTPIREALRDLARDGVLEVRPARGTYVRRMSIDDVRELYEVRQGLEGHATQLAAERGPTAALAAYRQRFQAMLDRPDDFPTDETYETGAEFHTEIFRAARNTQLLQIYEPIRLRFRLALRLPRHHDHVRVHASVSEHLDILQAIEAGDGDRARRLMSDHLARGAEVRCRIFETLAQTRQAVFMIEASSK